MAKSVTIPHAKLRTAQATSRNIYRDVFGELTDDAWLEVLQNSIEDSTINDVVFPGFPPDELQSGLHGSTGADALVEPFVFYKFVKAQIGDQLSATTDARLLDFGTGWGRIMRPFMRDFDLMNIYGYEPGQSNCIAARAANPFVNILAGEYLPNGRIPKNFFDLITSYSVYSHISPHATALWLRETASILRPGGHAVYTTWGMRFLSYLETEQKRLAAGEEIHWYSQFCLEKMGDLAAIREGYSAGDLVWVDIGYGALYGELFLSPRALEKLIVENDLPLELVTFDTASLIQDVFILRRK